MKKLLLETGALPCAAFLFFGALVPAAARPSWVDKMPSNTAETVYFRGLADGAASAADAEKAATRDLHARVAEYIMVGVRVLDREKTNSTQRGSGKAASNQFVSEFYSEIETFTDLPLSRVEAQTYSEEYGPSKRKLWRAWALGTVSRQKLETESAGYPKRISLQYSRRITDGGNLPADIRNRQSIIEDMDKNPLHKAAAQFKLPEGEVNLYDYISAQINELAESIVFEPIPEQKADKGKTLNLPLQISSPRYPSLGPLEYRVTLFRGGNSVQESPVPVIDTAPLSAGTYHGRVELRLSTLSPALRDITRDFRLEVTVSQPQPPDKPFDSGPLGGKWSGTLSYQANGQSYRDSYTVNFYAGGSCWVMITARDGAAQAALGHWSADVKESRIRLSCDFKDPVLTRIPAINWVAGYTLLNTRELRINVKPVPDYPGTGELLKLYKER